MTKLRYIAMTGVLMVMGVVPASADLIFSTSGSTSGGTVSGTADFNASGGTMTITLTNTTNPVDAIARVLDGLSFTLTGGSSVTLTNVVASGFEDCHSGSCSATNQFNTYKGNGDVNQSGVPSPYLWGYTAPLLAAGSGSYKPGGIVDSHITSLDGIPNGEHNDYLMGPVVFTFTYSGTITNVSNVNFFWGTTPESTTGSLSGTGNLSGTGGTTAVPEPASMALLGTLFGGIATICRKKMSQNS